MSYGRNPYYIYSDGEYMHFEMDTVPEEILNAFLYKILLTNRREELKERLKQGKKVWLQKRVLLNKNTGQEPITKDDFVNIKEFIFKIVPQDDFYIQWLEEHEDEIIKKLMGY